MPELPEVAGFKRYLDSTALHQRIVRTTVGDRRILEDVSPSRLARALQGQELTESARHGKYLFARVGGRGWLVLHFGMSGGLSYYRDEPPGFARVTLDFEGGRHLAYTNKRMLGKVGFADDLDGYVQQHGLGLDALSDALTGKRFVALLSGRSGPIKARLMDQSLLAGIGNEYSDEILFQARLHPETDASLLSHTDIGKLYRIMRRVLRTAAGKGGDVAQFPRGYFMPFRGKGERCPGCGGEVRKIRVVGRSGYYCPTCQRRKS